MRKQIITALTMVLLLCAATVLAEPNAVKEEPNKASYTKLIPPEKLKDDLDFLFKSIEEIHPNMYAYITKKEFSKLRAELYEKASVPMSRLEFYKAIAPVVAAIKNGHTFVAFFNTPNKEFTEYLNQGGKIFPLAFLFDGDLVMLGSFGGVEELPAGGEVLTIDGQNAKEFLIKTARYSPSENKAYNLTLMESRFYVPLFLWLEKGDNTSLRLTIKNIDGITNDYTIKALSSTEIKEMALKKKSQFAQNTQQGSEKWQPYSYHHLSDANSGVIKFDSFWDMEKFKKFLNDTFKEIKEKNIKYLIIDIRDNPGGNSQLGDEFLKYLTNKPFRQYDKCELKLSSQVRERHMDDNMASDFLSRLATLLKLNLTKPGYNPLRFNGKVYLLIGPKSASSATDFAQTVKYYKIGTLIGEETVDTVVNYGDCLTQKLPNSELDFSVACKYFVCVGGKPDGHGVIPDYEVKPKPEDVAKGVDTVMQFTLDLIKRGK